jgi:hypothetical protein
MRRSAKPSAVVLAIMALLPVAHAQVTLTEGTNFSVDVAADGRLAMDLLGSIWILPAKGGNAEPIATGLLSVTRPRWSPGGEDILFQARAEGRNELGIYRFASEDVLRLGNDRYSNQQADWHPDGDRIVFSSERHAEGLDLWETDIATGLAWRLSDRPGDETEPSWSADGRHLVYVSEFDGQWSLVVRRFGEPDHVLITSDEQLSAPSWRPDGSLVTFARHRDDGIVTNMLIFSDPLLERTLINDDDLFVAPVAWLDRQQMFYAANGVIRERRFDSWNPKTVPFRAAIGRPAGQGDVARSPRKLAVQGDPSGRIVLRADRIFDGLGVGYREQLDIVIEDGLISAVEARRDRSGEVVFDMGDLTVLPGFIDGYAALDDDVDERLGPMLLTFGVTTLVAESERTEELSERWAGRETPGPRVLAAASLDRAEGLNPWLVTVSGDMNAGLQHRDQVDAWQQDGVPVLAESWQAGLGSGAALLLGGGALPASPEGHRYQDMELAANPETATIFSGLADARTPQLDSLLASRQARLLPESNRPMRRFPSPPRLAAGSTAVVVGSKPNGLAPGLALHAEFRALQAAGLSGEQALRAAGVNAATALGLGLQVGRISMGAVADLVIVDGDPLSDVADALNVVGIVRNGRFYSTISLIEQIRRDRIVE